VIRRSKTHAAKAMLVSAFALVLVVAGSTAAFAAGHTAAATKTKTTKVSVVVSDTHVEGAPEHAPGTMSMTVTPASVRHGKVKFTLRNDGTEPHEMVVVKTNTPFDQMPVNSKNKVSEKGSVGEIASIGKGKTKSKTLKLKAGSYALVCNIAEHYAAGMRAGFTVT
jgi:uncharacterized cupredoxin-like copper-binding protein